MLRFGGLAIAVGLVAGLGLTYGTSRLLQSYLTGVTDLDASVILVGVALLALVGLVACLLPALRAAHVNPVVALRNE
jgi:ABC-type antimicrobial peptide transport system permease subunit